MSNNFDFLDEEDIENVEEKKELTSETYDLLFNKIINGVPEDKLIINTKSLVDNMKYGRTQYKRQNKTDNIYYAAIYQWTKYYTKDKQELNKKITFNGVGIFDLIHNKCDESEKNIKDMILDYIKEHSSEKTLNKYDFAVFYKGYGPKNSKQTTKPKFRTFKLFVKWFPKTDE